VDEGYLSEEVSIEDLLKGKGLIINKKVCQKNLAKIKKFGKKLKFSQEIERFCPKVKV
jgi:hypothetical protein